MKGNIAHIVIFLTTLLSMSSFITNQRNILKHLGQAERLSKKDLKELSIMGPLDILGQTEGGLNTKVLSQKPRKISAETLPNSVRDLHQIYQDSNRQLSELKNKNHNGINSLAQSKMFGNLLKHMGGTSNTHPPATPKVSSDIDKLKVGGNQMDTTNMTPNKVTKQTGSELESMSKTYKEGVNNVIKDEERNMSNLNKTYRDQVMKMLSDEKKTVNALNKDSQNQTGEKPKSSLLHRLKGKFSPASVQNHVKMLNKYNMTPSAIANGKKPNWQGVGNYINNTMMGTPNGNNQAPPANGMPPAGNGMNSPMQNTPPNYQMNTQGSNPATPVQ